MLPCHPSSLRPLRICCLTASLLVALFPPLPTIAQMASHQTAHFVVVYDVATDSGRLQWMVDVLEQACQDISSLYRATPPVRIPARFSREGDWARNNPPQDSRQGFTLGYYSANRGIHIRYATTDQPSPQALSQIQSVVYHELAHAFTHALGAAVPRWFDEGISTYIEYRFVVRDSVRIATNRLIPTFASDPYLGGKAAIDYLVATYGDAVLADLLTRSQRVAGTPGARPFDAALYEVTGLDPTAFERAVRDYHKNR